LTGGLGDDVLDGGLGADTFHGDGGVDTVSYASRTTAIKADADCSTEVNGCRSSGDYAIWGGSWRYARIDRASDDGAVGEGDTIAVTVESIIGGSGNDTLALFRNQDTCDQFCVDVVVPVTTGSLTGNSGQDVLRGPETSSNATITFSGGTGNDEIRGSLAADTISGGFGDDTIFGNSGDDTLNGDQGNDTLNGNSGNDSLNGGEGDDILRGGVGDDAAFGNAGVDTFTYDDRSEAVTASLGDVATIGNGVAAPPSLPGDPVLAGESDTINPDIENLTGGSGNDTLRARHSAINRVKGGPGTDVFDVESDDIAIQD
jgi:Ca2+-binding RTX toxin-like protein